MQVKGRQVQVSLYLTPAAARQLKALSVETRISQAALFREAVDDLLAKYGRLRPTRAGRARR